MKFRVQVLPEREDKSSSPSILLSISETFNYLVCFVLFYLVQPK